MRVRRGGLLLVLVGSSCLTSQLDARYVELCLSLGGDAQCRFADGGTGTSDAGVFDGGVFDAGVADAGVRDGGFGGGPVAVDASVVDAGAPCLDTTSDALNCGACGRRCEGACVQSLCVPVQVARGTALLGPHALLVSDAGLFVGESVYCQASTPTTECTSNRLFELVDGGFVERANGQFAISEIVLHQDRLYWNTWQEAGLYVMPRTGGTPFRFHHEDAGSTFGMVVHGSRLFVVRNAAPSQLLVFTLPDAGVPVRHPLLGSSGATMLALCGDDAFVAMQVDGPDGGLLQVARPGTSNAEVRWVMTGLDRPWGVACDEANVFVSEFGMAGRVLRAPRDGGPERVVASGLSQPRGIALDGPFAYVIEHENPAGPRRVWRFPVEGRGDAGVVVSDQVDGGIFLRLYDEHLYWTNYSGGTVVRVPRLPR